MKKLTLTLFIVLFLAACGGNNATTVPPVATTEANTPTPSINLTEVAADCQVTIESALELVSDVCADAGRNEVCYGNSALTVEPQSDDFDTPGDIVGLDTVQTIQLDPLNTDNDSWGVALMRIQANFPDTLPGQNVTFLLFGDVTLQNAGAQAFYFQSGIGEVNCNQQPNDGILVQTPETDLDIAFNMNGVDISLAGTAYLQAQPDESMTVDVIDGEAEVTVENTTTTVLAGFQTSVSLDADGIADAPPEETVPSEENEALPVDTLNDVQQDDESYNTPVPTIVSDANAITLGDEVSSTIDVAGEVDTYTLVLDSPQPIMFGGKGSDIPMQWDVSTDDGNLLVENEGMWYGNALGPFDLEAGTYTISVQAEHDELGEYTFRTWTVPEPQTFIYKIDDNVSGTIDVSSGKNIYTFTLEDETDLFFAALGTDTLARWQLETENGSIIFESDQLWAGNHKGPFTLEAGTYHIIVISEFDSVGTYEFRIWEQPEPEQFEITIPIAQTGELNAAGALHIYTFTVDDTQDYTFVAGGADGDIDWQLEDSDGNMIFEMTGLWQGNDPGTFELSAGEYTLTVDGNSDASGEYNFEIRDGGE